MTKRQLKPFFEYFLLEPDYSPEGITQLKKIVLLELKANQDHFLIIENVKWGKQDLLSLFDGELEDRNFDLERFQTLYPWVSLLEDPESIDYYSGLTRYEISPDEPLITEFQNNYAVVYQEPFLSELRKRFAGRNDVGVYALLCFQNAFSELFRFEMFVALAAMMSNRFDLTIKAIHESTEQDNLFRVHYMWQNAYFVLMNKLSLYDSGLNGKALMVLANAIDEAPINDALKLIRLQSKLQLEPQEAAFLSDMERSIAHQKRKQISRQVLFFVIIAIIMIAAIINS